MKTTPIVSVLFLISLFALTTGCKKDEVVPAFEINDAPYTAQLAFTTKNQTFATNAEGKNIIRVVLDGTGTYSFAGNVTLVDKFDFVLATGAATHKVTYTTTTGDKIYSTMTTQVGQTNITGTTTFTGGTGRFAKIKGSSPNAGPLVSATGEGSWKEEGGKVTF
ncbi:hypothetical protein [Spirosoma spitsbergense]|uniref:hypothetical protein n=1 Tax=Spirosoma spitsbergense TaxID=431554 RepID=UPI000367D475|nr:hypothetical protein [Spirosoma spitsbergense]